MINIMGYKMSGIMDEPEAYDTITNSLNFVRTGHGSYNVNISKITDAERAALSELSSEWDYCFEGLEPEVWESTFPVGSIAKTNEGFQNPITQPSIKPEKDVSF